MLQAPAFHRLKPLDTLSAGVRPNNGISARCGSVHPTPEEAAAFGRELSSDLLDSIVCRETASSGALEPDDSLPARVRSIMIRRTDIKSAQVVRVTGASDELVQIVGRL